MILALATASPIFAAVSLPAFAEDAVDINEIEEIIVTARRREESMQEIPVAVTAIDAGYLREQNITELNDLGTHVPALRVSDAGIGSNAPLVSIRGQRPSQVLLTLDPSVPMYFADVVLTPTFGTNLAMYDLANVQVLKGPQGTLFGRNSTGGALLLTPRTSGDEFGGYVDARVGSYNMAHIEAGFDLPISDALKMRIAGRSLDRDGYQSNVADNELRCSDCYGDEDSYGGRLVVEFSPNDNFSNLTTLSYDKNDAVTRVNEVQAYVSSSSSFIPSFVNLIHNDGLGAIAPLPGIPTENAVDQAVARQQARDWQEIETNTRPKEQIENTFAANVTQYDFSDNLSIKNILGYRKLDMVFAIDTDGTALSLFGIYPSFTSPVTRNPTPQETRGEQYSEELQLLGTAMDDRLEWIVGAFWMEMDGSDKQFTSYVAPNIDWPSGPSPIPQLQVIYTFAQIGFAETNPDVLVNNKSQAVFGEATYTFNEQWALTAGLRYTQDERELTTRNKTMDLAT